VVRVLRHVCGSVKVQEEAEGEGAGVNMGAVADLVRGDALRSLLHLASNAPKPYSSGLSRWIEVHAVDVLLTVVRHGMSGVLAEHLQRHDLLLPVLEALVTALESMVHAHQIPNLLGVVGLFKVLLQSCVAASAAGEHGFVEYVRSLDLAASQRTGSLSAVWSDALKVPLVLALLKHYIVELCATVYVEGKFSQETDVARLPPRARARAGREWGEVREDDSSAAVEGTREFKARRLAHELSASPALELSRDEAERQLRACEWDVEEAQRQLRALSRAAPGAVMALSGSAPAGGLGLRLVLPDDSAPNAPARHFVVAKVMEHGPAFRSSAVHVGDRLLKVDGAACNGMTLDALALRLKGPVGSQVTLVLQAQGDHSEDALPSRVRVVTLLRSALPDRPAYLSQVDVSDEDKEDRGGQVVERLKGAVSTQSAMSVLQKCEWDVERAVLRCEVLAQAQAIAHLLDIARELVFVGGNSVPLHNDPVHLADKRLDQEAHGRGGAAAEAGVASGGAAGLDTGQLEDGDSEQSMLKLAGRRVRDVEAFELLSELWIACPDDDVRVQLLEMGLVIYAEHPLNFFALSQTGLVGLAMDSLEFVGPDVRLRVLRVLEYVLTVERCLPLEHLCRLTRNLEAGVWRASTASLVLSNVIKWLHFDLGLVRVFRQTGLLHLLIRQCQEFSRAQKQRRQRGAEPNLHSSTPADPAAAAAVRHLTCASHQKDGFAAALEQGGVVAADGCITYQALAKHIRDVVHFESLSAELVDLAEEEAAVLLDRIWAAVSPQNVLNLVPVEWQTSCSEVVDFLRSIEAGDSVGMAAIEPVVIGEWALAISRAYVHSLKAGKASSPLGSAHVNTPAHGGLQKDPVRSAAVGGNGWVSSAGSTHQSTTTGADSVAPHVCMLCPRTFPVVIDTILALITDQSESVKVAREQGLVASMLELAVQVEWRDGALSVIERIILEDPFLLGDELSGLLALVSTSDPMDLELRTDMVHFMLKLAYAHPRVRAHMRFGWMVQAAFMIRDLPGASDSSWGQKLHLTEMLVTFICLGLASSETHRASFWTELGTRDLVAVFHASSLMSVGKGLTLLGMLLSIAVSRHVVPEAMLHGADTKGSQEDKSKRHWQGIGQSFDSATETAVFINRWGDHSGDSSLQSLTELSPRVRNPDAAVMAMLLIDLLPRDVQVLAARAILRLVRVSAHNARALTEAGFVSALLDRYSQALLGPPDNVLQPLLRELVVHFARHRLSVKDMLRFFACLAGYLLFSICSRTLSDNSQLAVVLCAGEVTHAARMHTRVFEIRCAEREKACMCGRVCVCVHGQTNPRDKSTCLMLEAGPRAREEMGTRRTHWRYCSRQARALDS